MVRAVAYSYGLPALKSHPSQGFESKSHYPGCAQLRNMAQESQFFRDPFH